MLGLIDESMESGASLDAACDTIGISAKSIRRWRRKGIGDDNRAGPLKTPDNELSSEERAEVLKVLNSPEYRDLSPWQVVATLADRGDYLASESTMYRILRAEKMQKHREPTRESKKRYRPDEKVATAPNQVWSWDITYLPSPVRGAYYYLYMVVDVFSRKVVAKQVHDCELGELAAKMIKAACEREGVSEDQLVIHADNGSPMKSATLLAMLLMLGVAKSFSRPSVSNDNPFSESIFRTVKCRPGYPKKPFASLEAARIWVEEFVEWYNNKHHHSGISFVTPGERHQGLDAGILEARKNVYEAARKRNPNRWSGRTRAWNRVDVVRLNPRPGVA